MSKNKKTALVIFMGIVSLAGLIWAMVASFKCAVSTCPLLSTNCAGLNLAKSDFFYMLATYLLVVASFCIPFTTTAVLKVRGLTEMIFEDDDDNMVFFVMANVIFGGFTLVLGCIWLAS